MIKFDEETKQAIIESLTIEKCESNITSELENIVKPHYSTDECIGAINHYRECIKVLRDHEASKAQDIISKELKNVADMAYPRFRMESYTRLRELQEKIKTLEGNRQ